MVMPIWKTMLWLAHEYILNELRMRQKVRLANSAIESTSGIVPLDSSSSA